MGRHDELYRAIIHELTGVASLLRLFELLDQIDLSSLEPIPAEWTTDELRARIGDSLLLARDKLTGALTLIIADHKSRSESGVTVQVGLPSLVIAGGWKDRLRLAVQAGVERFLLRARIGIAVNHE